MARRALTYNVTTQLERDVTTDDLIVNMQEEDELAAQKTILEKMRPKLREKFDRIRELLETEICTVLQNRYELGEQFRTIYDDETDNGAKIYGKGAVKNIVRVLGIDESLVRNCMKFVQLYSREDLEQLSTRLLPRGEHLSWSHLRCLVQVEDDKRRAELLEKTFDEGLTCAELAFEIKSGDDDGQDENRGRPPKIPATFDSMVQQQKQAIEVWERKNQKVWSHPKHSLSVRADELTDEEVTPERLKEAEELAHRLRGIAEEMNRAADKAEAVVKRFRAILVNRTGDEDAAADTARSTGTKKPKEGKRKLAAQQRNSECPTPQ